MSYGLINLNLYVIKPLLGVVFSGTFHSKAKYFDLTNFCLFNLQKSQHPSINRSIGPLYMFVNYSSCNEYTSKILLFTCTLSSKSSDRKCLVNIRDILKRYF